MTRWIVNASPLIVLARMGNADLLLRLPDELVIPSSVAREVSAGPADDPGRMWLTGVGYGRIHKDQAIPPAIAAWDLGAGETAVLAAAYGNTDCAAVVDDHAARECARALGIQVLGTVGVMLHAKRRGMIKSLGPLLRSLPRQGCHIAQSVLDEAIRLAGE